MRIAICDDNAEEYQHFAEYVRQIADDSSYNIKIDYYSCGDQLLFEWEDAKHHADILFLDINMPGTNGAETAKRLRSIGYHNEIVFLTVAKSLSMICNAFDVNAYHYIVKHEYAHGKIREIISRVLEQAKKNTGKYLLFESSGDSRNIAVDSIHFFDVMGRIVTVHYGNNQIFDFYTTFDKVAENMEAYGFFRIHRSYIVSINAIESISSNGVVLISGETLPVSRTYYMTVKNAFAERKKQLVTF